jgi:hypothetical protein
LQNVKQRADPPTSGVRRWDVDDVERAARLAGLARLAERFAMPRRRSPIEAPEELTLAYLDLIVACGFAHLADRARADALLERARGVLDPHAAHDDIHRYLLDAFVARARGTAGPPLGLGRVARYKVDRVRESSRLLEPAGGIEPIAQFFRRPAPPDPAMALPPDLAAIHDRFASDPDGAGAALDELLAVDLREPRSVLVRQRRLVDYARTLAPAPHARAVAWLVAIADAWFPLITDAFATNSHYCHAVLAAADTLVCAMAAVR